MDVCIRQAHLRDGAALAELHLRTALFAYSSIFPPDASRPELRDLILDWESRLAGLQSENTRGYVAEVRGLCVGAVLAAADPDHLDDGQITRLYVDASHWGAGIGRLLYDAAVAHLRRVGYVQASLWVLEDNARARSWYERLGWACTGERKVASGTVGVDDVRYTTRL